MELHCARPAGGMSISPILFSELLAYQQVFNVELSPFEIETIFFIDRAVLKEKKLFYNENLPQFKFIYC